MSSRKEGGPVLNEQIVKIGESGDLAGLLDIVGARLQHMNLVNLTTALHRLAKLPAEVRAENAEATKQAIALLLPAITRAVGRKERLQPSRCQTLCNVIWSLSALGVADLDLVRAVVDLCDREFECFKAFELVSLLGPLGRLSLLDRAVATIAAPVFERSIEPLRRFHRVLTFHRAAVAAFSFGQVGMFREKLFGVLAQRLTTLMAESVVSPSQLSEIAWAFRAAGPPQERLFVAIAEKAAALAPGCHPRELGWLVRCLSGVPAAAEALCAGLARQAAAGALEPWRLARLLAELLECERSGGAAVNIVLGLLPSCTQLVDEASPEDLLLVALLAALCFGGASGYGAKHGAADEVPFVVRRFFTAAAPRLQRGSGAMGCPELLDLLAAFMSVGCVDPPLLARTVQEVWRRGQDDELRRLGRYLSLAPELEGLQWDGSTPSRASQARPGRPELSDSSTGSFQTSGAGFSF